MINSSSTIDNITLEEGPGYPNHMLYAYYNGVGPSFTLILPAVLMNIAGIPGIGANLLLILVTWRKSNLRGSTNFLLAFTAFFEILHQSTHLFFLVIVGTGINFVQYSTALRFQLHTIFGLTAAQTMMASTAADRLLSVLMPMKYEHLNGFWYLSLHVLLAVASGVWMCVNAIMFATAHPLLPVTGYISDLLVLDMEVMFKFIMLMCAINILLYTLVWAIVRCGPTGNIVQQSHSKLFKSLVVIVLIVIGGYIINNVCRLVVNHAFTLDDIQMWMVNVFGGILLNIGASAETPTLYIFSTDYRKAINQEVARIFGKAGKYQKNKNTITVVSTMHPGGGARHSSWQISTMGHGRRVSDWNRTMRTNGDKGVRRTTLQ